MNDEIKEILEHIKTYPEKMYCLSEKEKIRILDYITNLQQENQDLKRMCELYGQSLYNADLTKCESRIDKAIEFVETNPLIWKPNMELTNLIENPNLKDMLYYKPDEWLHKLHTILEGDDENEE